MFCFLSQSILFTFPGVLVMLSIVERLYSANTTARRGRFREHSVLVFGNVTVFFEFCAAVEAYFAVVKPRCTNETSKSTLLLALDAIV